jgi:hypothetical protein
VKTCSPSIVSWTSSAVVATTTNGPHLTAGRAAVRWCRTGHLTWSFVPTRDADVRLVGDFVRRLRRVALHPVALVQELPPAARRGQTTTPGSIRGCPAPPRPSLVGYIGAVDVTVDRPLEGIATHRSRDTRPGFVRDHRLRGCRGGKEPSRA